MPAAGMEFSDYRRKDLRKSAGSLPADQVGAGNEMVFMWLIDNNYVIWFLYREDFAVKLTIKQLNNKHLNKKKTRTFVRAFPSSIKKE